MELSKKQDILVYGAGTFFKEKKKMLQQYYNIKAIIDKNKGGVYENWKIIKISECHDFIYEKIVIMVENVRTVFLIIRDLLNDGIESNRIIWGGIYGAYGDIYDEVKILSDGKICVSKNGIKVAVSSTDEFNNVYETLVEECYHYRINNNKKDVVIDVGMNVGDATLYFLAGDKVEKVYAYEPFYKTFQDAKRNLKDYLDNEDRLEIFQYGLSDVTEYREITYNEDMTCGMSTQKAEELDKYNVYKFYYDNGYAEQQKERIEKISVINAADVLKPIIQKYRKSHNIVLKMDCEGEEYGIIELLNREGILHEIDFMMLEWHYQGKESILRELSKAGFSYLCTAQRENMGSLSAWHDGGRSS